MNRLTPSYVTALVLLLIMAPFAHAEPKVTAQSEYGFITENVELMSFLMNCLDFRNLQKMSLEVCRIYGESQQNSMSP